MRMRYSALVLLFAVGCSGTGPREARETDPFLARLQADRETRAVLESAALRPFRDCEDVVAYFRAEASHRLRSAWVGRHGHKPGAVALDSFAGSAQAGAMREAPVPVMKEPSAPGDQPGSFSKTNVQEEGVDEPDTVKTDGSTLFYARGGSIFAASIGDGALRVIDSLALKNTFSLDLLLSGDRLIAVDGGGMHGGWGTADVLTKVPSRGGPGWRGETTIRVIDVSDPSAMRVVDTASVEGSYVSARMVGGIVRLVIRTTGAGVELRYPTDDSRDETRRVDAANREAIERSTLEDWLPRYRRGEDREDRVLTSCDAVRKPARFSGFDSVSVLTLDPADPSPRDAATVVGAGDIVYASEQTLYVTSAEYLDTTRGVARQTTKIHAFDITDARAARYVASGEIVGALLNQWSLSEHDGKLRVASTRFDLRESQSRVDVLERQGPVLKKIGGVGGLGKTERIYAVRFIGSLGYVVTFRQVDPLYVIDLTDPTRPRVRGELKIPGYSAYLHPVDAGRLLGVGQDATSEGRTLGVQVSLFDVSDPEDPKQLAKQRLGLGHSPVEHDHHAFLWWAPQRLAMVPMTQWGDPDPDGQVISRNGAAAIRVGEDGTLRRVARIEQPTASNAQHDSTITRVVVAGDRMLTISALGLMSTDLETFDREGWVRWSN